MSKAATARDEAEVQNISKFFRRIQEAVPGAPLRQRPGVREASRRAHRRRARIRPWPRPTSRRRPCASSPSTRRRAWSSRSCSWCTCVQGQLPVQKRARRPGAARRAASGIVPPSGDFHTQDERRLFYVGMTRARRELLPHERARDYGGRPRAQGQPVRAGGARPPARTRRGPSRRKAVEEIDRVRGRHARAGARRAAPPHATRTEELLISHKQVDDYQTCPLKYRYVHVLRVPILRHHTVVYGSTIHAVVEFYLKRRRAEGNYTSAGRSAGGVRAQVAEPGVPHLGASGGAQGRGPRGAHALLAPGGGRRAPGRPGSRRSSRSASGRTGCEGASTGSTRTCWAP